MNKNVEYLFCRQASVHFLAGERNFSLLQNVQTSSGAHPVSISEDTVVLSVRVKWPWLEANYPPLFSAGVRKGWSYTSASPVYLHGLQRYNFIFYLPCPVFLLTSELLSSFSYLFSKQCM
jgi:hypothetical protein